MRLLELVKNSLVKIFLVNPTNFCLLLMICYNILNLQTCALHDTKYTNVIKTISMKCICVNKTTVYTIYYLLYHYVVCKFVFLTLSKIHFKIDKF